MNKSFCEIILSQRFPKHLGVFDYAVPAELQKTITVGQLVTIPFRKSLREGVVIKIKNQAIGGKQIKAINDIRDSHPLLTAPQLFLAEQISNYYFVSRGTVLKMILPPIPKRGSSGKKMVQPELLNAMPADKLSAAYDQWAASQPRHCLYWTSSRDYERFFMKKMLVHTALPTLIIVPTVQDCNEIMKLIPPTLIKTTVALHGQLNKNENYSVYQRVLHKEVKIIVGTKLALFLPFTKLEAIIITQAENRNHKQSDQNPRYDVKTVAKWLSEKTGAKIVSITHAPTVEQYAQIKNHALYQLSDLPEDSHETSIIDMREEVKKRNSYLFSEKLIDEVERALKQKKQAFLFLNRRGTSTSVVCKDCGFVHKCDDCRVPLIYHGRDKILFCHQCNKRYELPPFCPKCHGVFLKFLGSGTQEAENEAKTRWPRAQITRYDKDAEKTKIRLTGDIIIGTEKALPLLNWEGINVIGVLNADQALYIPDFRSGEKTYQILSFFNYAANCAKVIQTRTPEHPALLAIAQQKPELFYDNDLRNHASGKYPPYAVLVKCTYASSDKKKCLNEVQRVYRMLQASPLDISLITPLHPFDGRKWKMHIILKIKTAEQERLLPKIISQIPDTWVIDRDPQDLL